MPQNRQPTPYSLANQLYFLAFLAWTPALVAVTTIASQYRNVPLLQNKPVVFETRHRVRFREVDAYGHMNMAHYLTYYQDHRFEGMRNHLGLGIEQLMSLPIAFHVRAVELEYLRPLFADQEFVVRSYITEWKSAQCYVALEMTDLGGELVSTAKMRIGCIEKKNGRPCIWPEGVKERFFT